MVTVRGIAKDGLVEPLDELNADEGAEVTILVPRGKTAGRLSSKDARPTE